MDRLFGLDSVSSHDSGLELLMTIYNPAELTVVTSILEGADIPFLAKDRGAGGTMKIIAGYSVFGTDIFVRADMLDDAVALFAESEFENAEDAEND